MKGPWKHALLLLFSAAAVLLLTEISLRLIDPETLSYYRKVKLLHVYHPDYYVGLKKNNDLFIRHHDGLWEGRFTTNSLGFRGSPEPESGTYKIACLGDSLVMGFGVSDHETFCSRLNGTVLKGKRVQAFNLGVDAFGSLGYYRRLKEASGMIDFDLVLLFVSANDFYMPEELRAVGILSDDEKDEIRMEDPKRKAVFRLQFELTRISYALMAAKLSYEQLKIKWQGLKHSVIDELESAGLIPSGRKNAGIFSYVRATFYRNRDIPCRKGASQEGKPGQICPFSLPAGLACEAGAPHSLELAELPSSTRKAYDQMILLVREKNIKLVPVMFPVQTSTIYCAMNRKYSREYDFALQIRDYFIKNNIHSMDLLPHVPGMCEAGTEERKRPPFMNEIIIPGDGHLTSDGNLWAAEALKEELKKLNAL